jgi:8-oxo-dGTP pyrophosphatase MutT (NUDIX family)
VFHDEVTRPDGGPGIYGVVSFKTRAVGVVALDDSGRVLLVEQYRYTLGEDSLEIPEGGVPFEESMLDGAHRELAEETGYTAAEWRDLGPFATSNSITDEVGRLYLATRLTAGEPHPDGTEAITARWLPLDEAVAMVERGEITDAMSQIGLLRVALERERLRS